MTNLSLHLVEAADMYPDRPAVRCDGATTTYSELADNAARFGAYLGYRGIHPGDRVGVMLANGPAFAMVFYGVLHAGGVVVPIDPLQSAREVEFCLTNAGARVLVVAPSCRLAATAGALSAGVPRIVLGDRAVQRLTGGFLGQAWPVTRAGNDNAVILHTAEKTGIRRGVQLTHRNLVCNQAVIARRLLGIGPGDVVLGCLPLSDAFGLTCVLAAAISTGATLALLPGFDPRAALKTIAAERVTIFAGEPARYAAMLAAAAHRDPDFGSLRICISAGAAMPAQVLRGFENLSGSPVLEGYGMPETSGPVCFTHPAMPRKAGSIGTPIDGVQVRVVDEHCAEVPTGTPGEIHVRGHNVMKGYWNSPESTANAIVDGWFSTGDIGRVDEDGHLFLMRGRGG
ncbi:AMP-binding protein [Mycobacterium sp.]|uniref:AMP-binding protein n=1 Tax=Mycobacterium sp. TaxID=1785 RepID=UPI003C77AA58